MTKKLTASIGGREFELRPTFPRFAAIGLAAAQRSGDEMKATEAMWRMCRALVKDWAEFDDFMTEHDEAFDGLDSFLDEAIRAYNLGPTDESSPSSSSSEPKKSTSRVVSLSQGTVTESDEDEETEPEPEPETVKPKTRKRTTR